MDETGGMEAVISRWEASGLSLRRFGAQEGISYSKLAYWRRKLRGAKAVRKRRAPAKESETSALVAVQVVADETPAAPSPSPFSIWLGNGMALDVPPGFDERELRRLLDLLSSC